MSPRIFQCDVSTMCDCSIQNLPAETRAVGNNIEWNRWNLRELGLVVDEEDNHAEAKDKWCEDMSRIPRVLNTAPCKGKECKGGTSDDNEVSAVQAN
jgi:hypothetical protein